MNITLKTLSMIFFGFMLAISIGCTSTDKTSSTGEYLDDTVITTRVKSAIFSDSELRSSEINVETFKGVVQLSGFVSSQAEINRAVALTKDVKGVDSVKNDMRLR